MIRLLTLITALGSPAMAESIVAARTIPANTVLTFDDLTTAATSSSGGVDDPFELVGKEARVSLYAGRPIKQSDVIEPAVVERNQMVLLIYQSGSLSIRTDGRALDRAAAGQTISVMNLNSRSTVLAEIGSDGAAYVRPNS